MYALIRNDAIVLTGPLPWPTWPDPDARRWWDMRDPAQVALAGWVPVTIQPRPADTETTTWDRSDPDLENGLPVIGWTERDKTEQELSADAQAQVAEKLTADTNNDEAKIIQAIEDLRIVLGDNATEGSLRQVRATFNNQYNVATVRTLIDVLITQAQANRRIARQLLRVQRLTTGDFDSADVGEE